MNKTMQGIGENQLKPVVVPTQVGHAQHAMPTTTTTSQDNHQATQSVGMEIEVTTGHVKEEQIDIRATSQRTPRRAPSHQTGQMQPLKKGLSATAVVMIVVGGICLLAAMVAVSISVGVSIGHSRERHQALVDKQIVMMPAPAESEPIIYDAGLPATSAATKPAAAAPSLTEQTKPAAEEEAQTYLYKLEAKEFPFAAQWACDETQSSEQVMKTLQANNPKLSLGPKATFKVGQEIVVTCQLEPSSNGKHGTVWKARQKLAVKSARANQQAANSP